jgi:hypothetical protein
MKTKTLYAFGLASILTLAATAGGIHFVTATVHPQLVPGAAVYAPVTTPGGGHAAWLYTVNGLTNGASYTLVTDGSCQQIVNFQSFSPAKLVQIPRTAGTHVFVSNGDTLWFYGSETNKTVNCSLIAR